MANPDHVRIAKEGAVSGARRGVEFAPDTPLDLSEADLQGLEIRNANLERANFRGANLTKAHIFNCVASWANFEGACLNSASLALSELASANFLGADLSNADLTSTDLTCACFVNAKLSNARLTRALFERNELDGACFQYALADGTFFLNLDLSNARNLDKSVSSNCLNS